MKNTKRLIPTNFEEKYIYQCVPIWNYIDKHLHYHHHISQILPLHQQLTPKSSLFRFQVKNQAAMMAELLLVFYHRVPVVLLKSLVPGTVLFLIIKPWQTE